jgi:hypothetical protein
MIGFRHYGPSRLHVTNYYGICLSIHRKRKTLDIYMGKHTFVVFWGRSY